MEGTQEMKKYQEDFNEIKLLEKIKRFKIQKDVIEKIYQELKNKGNNFIKLRNIIGTSFEKAYYKDSDISETVFKKLESLVGHEIPHIIIERALKYTYNENDVKKWKEFYEIYGNFTRICKMLIIFEPNNSPSVTTIKRLLKEILHEKYNDWYNKYRLMGKYSWNDAIYWKELYERLHSFRKVQYFIKNKNRIGPNETIIRKYIKKYMTKILEENYDEWVDKYSENLGNIKYSIKDYMVWKELYEKFGRLKDVYAELKNYYKNVPDPITIRQGLREILGDKYDEWLLKYAKPIFSIDEVKNFKKLFQEHGTLKAVSDITGHDVKTIKKSLKKLLANEYHNWYSTYSIHHERKWTQNDFELWKILFEEIGNFNFLQKELEPLYGEDKPSTAAIKKSLRQHIIDSGDDYNEWIIQYSLSDIIVTIGKMIHIILEYYFMLHFSKNFSPFYEISPNKSFRVDNSIIIDKSINSFISGIPSNIYCINFDYTLASMFSTIYPKLRKGYHNQNMILIIITLFSKIEDLTFPLDIDFKENIKIIDLETFLNISGFDSIVANKIVDAINLARKAIYNPSSFEELNTLSDELKYKLHDSFGSRAEQQNSFNNVILNIMNKSQ